MISLKNIIMLIVAGIINAIGVTIFLSPVSLYDSGISGTSMLLVQMFNQSIPLSAFLLLLNIPLFLFGLKKQGKAFTIYSVIAVSIYSIAAFVITDVLPIDISSSSPITGQDLFLCAIFGGVVSGIGSGLTIRFGGAIDGIDVLSVIFAKRLGLSIGSFVMCYNVVLYIICAIIANSWVLALYSVVTYAVVSVVIDFIVDGLDKAKEATIITTAADEICKELSDTLKTGLTIVDVKGYYSGDSKTMIFIIVNRFQIATVRDVVHKYDKKAFISISDVADVVSHQSERNE